MLVHAQVHRQNRMLASNLIQEDGMKYGKIQQLILSLEQVAPLSNIQKERIPL